MRYTNERRTSNANEPLQMVHVASDVMRPEADPKGRSARRVGRSQKGAQHGAWARPKGALSTALSSRAEAIEVRQRDLVRDLGCTPPPLLKGG
jgi:hypothetical protein